MLGAGTLAGGELGALLVLDLKNLGFSNLSKQVGEVQIRTKLGVVENMLMLEWICLAARVNNVRQSRNQPSSRQTWTSHC